MFLIGLREKLDPQIFLAERGLQEIIEQISVDLIIKYLKSLILILKENLKTLDDDICIMTINTML